MPEIDFEEFKHANGRLPHRLYVSKAFSYPGKTTIRRNAWKRLEDGPLKELVRDGEEFVLHETDTGIQQIKARFSSLVNCQVTTLSRSSTSR